jgi:hypothetical protein
MQLVDVVCLVLLSSAVCDAQYSDVVRYSENFLEEIRYQKLALVRFGSCLGVCCVKEQWSQVFGLKERLGAAIAKR